MATTINTGSCADSRSPCSPVAKECPSCGGLECLCRPRFFAGQLLTEDNLNHLNQYIIKKNQLHNRYLHGTGVVCGLEVSCAPCDDQSVQISEGYALSPCGNDIVVCAQDSVDICELLKECRSNEPRDCRPYGKTDKNCNELEETWLLGICYEETASRGITALRSSSNKKQCSETSPRGAPPQCEPTQVCEVYRYRLFKIPSKLRKVNLDDIRSGYLTVSGSKGPFYDRLFCCLEPLLELLQNAKNMSNDLWVEQCCKIKAELREIIIQHDSANCELLKRLNCIQCEQQVVGHNIANSQDALFQLLLIGFQIMIDCICHSLMPPCPEPALDDCVPLAAITVVGKDCRVKKVCNWTEHRKYVITMPTLKYWLSILTRGKGLSGLLEKLCCDTKGIMDAFDPCKTKMKTSTSDEMITEGIEMKMHESLSAQPELDLKSMKSNQDFSKIVQRALTRPAGSLTLDKLMNGLVESPDDSTVSLLSDVERNNPGEFLMMNMLLQPFVNSFIPKGSSQLTDLKDLTNSFAIKSEDVDLSKSGITELQAEMKEMKLTMKSQANEILELRSQIKGKE